jgi:phosphatidylglycerol lysyltransferase
MTVARDYKSIILTAITVIVFAVAVIVLRHLLADLSPAKVLASLGEIRFSRVLLCVFFTVCSYTTLTLYDYLALQGVGHPLPWRRAALTSFTAFAIGHSTGMSWLSGGSVRYRGYSADGLSTMEIAGVIGLVSGTFALGVGTLLGLSLLLASHEARQILHLHGWQLRMLGAAVLVGLCLYLWLCLRKSAPIRIGRHRIKLPPFEISLGQLVVASVDLCFAAASLYVLLPPEVGLHYLGFLGLYVLSLQAGVLSNTPGGLGVFETVLIGLLSSLPGAANESTAGAVLLYRFIYYFIPLALGIGLLVGRSALERKRDFRRWTSTVQMWMEQFAPRAVAAAVFVGGTVLLLSGATPEIDSRMEWLRGIVPLPVLELSHLIGSAVGVGLLILARGLHQRLDGAWWTAMVLLTAGIAASLLKGLDYEEATLLAAVGLVLWITRNRFYRRSSLLDLRSSRAWAVAVVLVVAAAVLLSIVAYRDVQYAHELWWQFAFDDDAPRVMRAGLLTVLLACAFALWQLFSPSREEPSMPDALAIEKAGHIAAGSQDTLAYLALLGDKQLLFAEAGDAFIMYQRSGRSMVALGDPAGNPLRFEALCWQFRELCDRNSCWPVFYQVSAERLPLYLDLGLELAKLGEEARVLLPEFGLEGSARSGLRNDYRRCARLKVAFRVLPPAEVECLLPRLHEISDEWLLSKATSEKGFSVGRFAPDYLRRFPCACVMVEERVVAFANLWLWSNRQEFSIDLMRYGREAPKGVMDYLFVELMLWGKAEGYRWFNLGMAPLAGLEKHPLAPFWHKLGVLVHRFGEPFYNFEGLRRYKDKFGPQWRPRYLASPGGLVLPRVLLDTAALIAGGVKEVVWK